MRRMIAKYGAKAQDAAARRIQRVWMRRARNRWLQERVGRVFAMARAGDVDGMTRELRSNPDVLYMRDRCVKWHYMFEQRDCRDKLAFGHVASFSCSCPADYISVTFSRAS